MSNTPTFPAHTGKPLPPHQQDRIKVYAVADGAALLCFPVDAKELVSSGAYTQTPPSSPSTEVPTEPVKPVKVGRGFKGGE